ncbi:MAG: hypothetical protein Q8867_05025 [Bacteroidota bacterium]|nr:hypothetical protein [Bacteroidota bacterium]
MKQPDSRIIEFIDEHHIFDLAVSRDNHPWIATCFYTYIPERNLFVFTSDDDTRHIRDVEETRHYDVAGAIALETHMVGKIRGIQFTGLMHRLEGVELEAGRKAYVKKFPIARLSELKLWGLEPQYVKMTDNRLGFGKKLIWQIDNPDRS